MDPVSVGLLTALAGGPGGELGRQAWAGLGELVRRPFRRTGGPAAAPDPVAAASGEAELARLAEDPRDPAAARALGAALAARADADAEFGELLRRWSESAQRISLRSEHVHNSISGGTFSAPVFQGRDFSGMTFGAPAPKQDPADG
ncbi:hypothetical protein FRZ03_34905 [Streptomyces misionensis]|uniref:Uncharacterized protein n=1 Tax=Streptomyces misionensis TaxID=67331 RepID=A0A5C6IRU4_9ACTN|nr:hypothetical protein [Streptomyces misionensis]TWV31666.1 hypothetical protein FRZ03_34905 [Streptomyces misionensis]